MRWAGLFADLEAQAEALDRADRVGEIAGRTRAEFGRQALGQRLVGATGRHVRLTCVGGGAAAGLLRQVGPDWALLDELPGRECLVALPSVISVSGQGRWADELPGGAVAARLGIRHMLRGLSRDRSTVRVSLVDGATIAATIDRVGADFVELALHSGGELRRRGEVRSVALVSTAAITLVQRDASRDV
jgi:hypothetical protein